MPLTEGPRSRCAAAWSRLVSPASCSPNATGTWLPVSFLPVIFSHGKSLNATPGIPNTS